MSLKQQRLEFLMDTVNYYSEDTNRRAVNKDGRCLYYDKTTQNRCAIGRWINPEKIDAESFLFFSVQNDKVFKLLPENIQLLGKHFLKYIQELHDDGYNWDKNGLTEQGKQKVQKLKEEYC